MQLTTADDQVILHRFYEIVCADHEWVSEEFAAIVGSLRPAATGTVGARQLPLHRDAHREQGSHPNADLIGRIQRSGIDRVRSPP